MPIRISRKIQNISLAALGIGFAVSVSASEIIYGVKLGNVAPFTDASANVQVNDSCLTLPDGTYTPPTGCTVDLLNATITDPNAGGTAASGFMPDIASSAVVANHQLTEIEADFTIPPDALISTEWIFVATLLTIKETMGGSTSVTTTYALVPEPASFTLLAVGLAGLGFARRRKLT